MVQKRMVVKSFDGAGRQIYHSTRYMDVDDPIRVFITVLFLIVRRA